MKKFYLPFTALCLLGTLLFYWKGPARRGTPVPVIKATVASGREGSSSEATAAPIPPPEPAQESAAEKILLDLLSLLQGRASDPSGGRGIPQALEDVKRRLLEEEPDAATDAILRMLKNHQDAPTGLEFAPGEGGLRSASTFRGFLLDTLGAIDPAAADLYAQEAVFPRMESAEEYAIALRNLFWNGPLGQRSGEFRDRLDAMFSNEQWARDPAFLETWDAIPLALRPEETVTLISELLKGDPKFEGAARLALERAVLKNGQETIGAVASSNHLPGALRAETLARADLRDNLQRSAVESYLANLKPGSEEAAIFFGAFPNHNFSVAPGLFEQPRLPDARKMGSMDLAARDVVAEWRKRFAQHQVALNMLLEKLEENARNLRVPR